MTPDPDENRLNCSTKGPKERGKRKLKHPPQSSTLFQFYTSANSQKTDEAVISDSIVDDIASNAKSHESDAGGSQDQSVEIGGSKEIRRSSREKRKGLCYREVDEGVDEEGAHHADIYCGRPPSPCHEENPHSDDQCLPESPAKKSSIASQEDNNDELLVVDELGPTEITVPVHSEFSAAAEADHSPSPIPPARLARCANGGGSGCSDAPPPPSAPTSASVFSIFSRSQSGGGASGEVQQKGGKRGKGKSAAKSLDKSAEGGKKSSNKKRRTDSAAEVLPTQNQREKQKQTGGPAVSSSSSVKREVVVARSSSGHAPITGLDEDAQDSNGTEGTNGDSDEDDWDGKPPVSVRKSSRQAKARQLYQDTAVPASRSPKEKPAKTKRMPGRSEGKKADIFMTKVRRALCADMTSPLLNCVHACICAAVCCRGRRSGMRRRRQPRQSGSGSRRVWPVTRLRGSALVRPRAPSLARGARGGGREMWLTQRRLALLSAEGRDWVFSPPGREVLLPVRVSLHRVRPEETRQRRLIPLPARRSIWKSCSRSCSMSVVRSLSRR